MMYLHHRALSIQSDRQGGPRSWFSEESKNRAADICGVEASSTPGGSLERSLTEADPGRGLGTGGSRHVLLTLNKINEWNEHASFDHCPGHAPMGTLQPHTPLASLAGYCRWRGPDLSTSTLTSGVGYWVWNGKRVLSGNTTHNLLGLTPSGVTVLHHLSSQWPPDTPDIAGTPPRG